MIAVKLEKYIQYDNHYLTEACCKIWEVFNMINITWLKLAVKFEKYIQYENHYLTDLPAGVSPTSEDKLEQEEMWDMEAVVVLSSSRNPESWEWLKPYLE